MLSGRGLDAAAAEVAELHAAVEADPSPRNVRAFSNAEEAFGNAGGYAAEAEVRRIAAGLGLAADRLDLPIGALSGGERRRVELARILFAGDDLLLLDEPTNHLDVDAKEWLMTFLRTFRGALLVISHDLALLDQAITRILHLDDGELIEYRGTYSQYLVARKEDEARRAKLATRQESEIVRLKSLADVMRRQTQSRARTAKSLDTRVERMRREQVQAAKAERTLKVKLPEPPRAGKVVLEVEDLAKAFGPKVVFEDVTFDVGRGERLLVLGLNGAGKTTLLRSLVGEMEPELGDGAARPPGLDGLLRAGARRHQGGPDRDGARARSSPASPTSTSAACSACSDCAVTSSSRTRARSPAARRPSSRSRCSSPARTTCCCSTSRPTTSTRRRASRSARRLRDWKGAMVIVSHDTEFVTELAPDRVLLMPEGVLDYWSDDLLDLVALA